MIDPELLKILCCPETHQSVAPADPSLIKELNLQIASGRVRNRAGQSVTEQIEEGLLRADGKVLYPVRSHIPVMLIDEAIPLPA